MSAEAFAIALHHSKAHGAAKLVLIGIANHDGDGGSWPAVATLAKYAHTDRRAVQRYLNRLESLGEIRRLVGQGGNHATADHRRPNLYKFMLSCPVDCDRTKNHRTRRDESLMLDIPGLEGAVNQPAVNQPHAVSQPGEGAVNQPHELSLELNNSSNTGDPSTGAREANEKDASGDSHQPASAMAGKCHNGHPYIDASGGGVPFCALGCSPIENRRTA